MGHSRDTYPDLFTWLWLTETSAGSFIKQQLSIEQWFQSRYQVDAVLGVGHTAVVLRAQDTKLDRTVALKIWHSRGYGVDSSVVLREGRILARLEHPNIVKVYDFGIDEDKNTPWTVLEYLGEKTLYGLTQKSIGLRHDWPTILTISTQIAALVEYLHNSADLFQLDLKPGNLAVMGDSDRVTVKLMDLGSAYGTSDSHTTRLGTPGYIAPELFMDVPFSKPSDMFSLGVIFYELMTGETPLMARQEEAIGRKRPDSFSGAITAAVPIQLSDQIYMEKSDEKASQGLLQWMRTLQLAPSADGIVIPREYANLVRDLTQFQASERPSAQATRGRLQQLSPKTFKTPTVFISHAHKDKDRFVDRFVSALRERGLNVWIDIDSLRTGQPFWEEIGKAIQESDFVILILSNNSIRSEGVSEELRTAQLYNLSQVRLLPIRIDPLDFAQIPHHIRSRHVLDFVGWESAELLRKMIDKLVSDIFALKQQQESTG